MAIDFQELGRQTRGVALGLVIGGQRVIQVFERALLAALDTYDPHAAVVRIELEAILSSTSDEDATTRGQRFMCGRLEGHGAQGELMRAVLGHRVRESASVRHLFGADALFSHQREPGAS